MSSCNSGDTASTEDGILTVVHDENGTLTGYERRYHNTDGDISRLDVYDADQVYDHFVLYEYDSDRRLTRETTYRADGIGDFFYTYSYDDDDHVVEKGYYTASDGAEVTRYDADGNETERFLYDRNDDLYQHDILENGEWVSYDADDQPIE